MKSKLHCEKSEKNFHKNSFQQEKQNTKKKVHRFSGASSPLTRLWKIPKQQQPRLCLVTVRPDLSQRCMHRHEGSAISCMALRSVWGWSLADPHSRLAIAQLSTEATAWACSGTLTSPRSRGRGLGHGRGLRASGGGRGSRRGARSRIRPPPHRRSPCPAASAAPACSCPFAADGMFTHLDVSHALAKHAPAPIHPPNHPPQRHAHAQRSTNHHTAQQT